MVTIMVAIMVAIIVAIMVTIFCPPFLMALKSRGPSQCLTSLKRKFFNFCEEIFPEKFLQQFFLDDQFLIISCEVVKKMNKKEFGLSMHSVRSRKVCERKKNCKLSKLQK